MDKLCTWQLVNNTNDPKNNTNSDERDWTQSFCVDVVECQFELKLGDMCALLRRKLFPHSLFSDEENWTDAPSPGSKKAGSRSNHKLARSSTSSSVAQFEDRHASKPSVQSHATTSDMQSHSRSWSVSFAQDASARRCNASGTASSLKCALSYEVSMSRAFKPRVQPSYSQASQRTESCKVTRDQGGGKEQGGQAEDDARCCDVDEAQGPKNNSKSSNEFDLESEREDDGLPCVEDEDGLWLPNSLPEVLLLGSRKRSASGSRSGVSFSDPIVGVGTPVKKRLRI